MFHPLRRCSVVGGLIIFSLGGCVTVIAPAPENVRLIYQTEPGPFCGRCFTTKILVTNNNRIWIEQRYWAGEYSDERIVRREIVVTQQALADFTARLNQFRPSQTLDLGDPSQCADYSSDQGGIDVTWRDVRGEVRLHYDYGCDPQTRRDMRAGLMSAPQLLGAHGFRIPELE